MNITKAKIKEIIREELSRVNEALSKGAAEDAASMYNSDHWGLSHRQLVQMIMKHGHIDAAYPEYLEFRDGHEHNRGDYVEDSEDVDYDIDRRRMNKPMGTKLEEAESFQTDKGFRPVSSAIMRIFGDEPLLRELSASAISQVLAVIYEDLNS